MTEIDSRELENAYLAGLFDGEGSVWLNNSGQGIRYPNASIAQQDRDFLLALKEKYGGEVNKLGTALYFSNAGDVSKLLTRMLPYLILKYKEAFIIIELCKLIGPSGKNITDRDRLLRLKLEELFEKAAAERKVQHKH